MLIIKRHAAVRQRNDRAAPKIEKSFAYQRFRNAADEMVAKMPPYRGAPLSVTVTVYPFIELPATMASQLALALNYNPNE